VQAMRRRGSKKYWLSRKITFSQTYAGRQNKHRLQIKIHTRNVGEGEGEPGHGRERKHEMQDVKGEKRIHA